VEGDADYEHGGQDTVVYEIPLADIGRQSGAAGSEAELAEVGRNLVAGGSVVATLHYQATPPHYLAQRFADGRRNETVPAQSANTRRLYYLASNLDLDDTAAAGWKLPIDSASVAVQ
jgi:hypothetical protein